MSDKTSESLPGVQAYKQRYFVQTAKMFTDATYPPLGKPDLIFKDHLSLSLQSGEKIELSELPDPGVSSNQTVAFVPRVNALFVGDLIHDQAHAWLEGGIVDGKATPTLNQWMSDLNFLRQQFRSDVRVYGGRGNSVSLSDAVKHQVCYLKTANQIVDRYLAQIGAKRSELDGDQAGKHYLRIQKRFEAKFPKYEFSYLIQSGVYGLVNSKLLNAKTAQ